MMRIFCFYGVKKIKSNALPKGPYVIISNHSSYLDIFLMHSILPDHPFLFLGKSEILNYPIIKTYFKGLNIPVNRKDRQKSARSFIMAKRAVQEGWSIVIFPEGTIPDQDNPKMYPFKEGAFRLARALQIPIVPLTFTNNFKLFSDPGDFKGTARPGRSRLYIHPYVSVEDIASMSDKELSDHCFNLINQPLIQEYPELFKDSISQ
jgi:1-acyl-sn-glycerol-3-phosphate acyltransferase